MEYRLHLYQLRLQLTVVAFALVYNSWELGVLVYEPGPHLVHILGGVDLKLTLFLLKHCAKSKGWLQSIHRKRDSSERELKDTDSHNISDPNGL